jgi:hypothetical protein
VGETLEIQEDCGTLTIEYDKDVDIMYIKLKEGKYTFSEEINDSAMMTSTPKAGPSLSKFTMSQTFLAKSCFRGPSGLKPQF